MQPASIGRLGRLATFAAVLAAASCGDLSQPTSPAAPQPEMVVTIAAKPAPPSITTAQYIGPFVIGGASFDVTVTVTNPGKSTLKDVSIVALVTQGAASREAARVPVTCANSPAGLLPGGETCATQFAAAVSNSSTGTGTLAAGAAQFELLLVQTTGKKENVLDSTAEGVTLSEPGAPDITDLQLVSSTIVLENSTDYTVYIDNPGAPVSLILQAEITQGTSTVAAAGTVISVPSGSSTFDYHAVASNANAGGGNLVPGAAELVVHLIDGSTTLDSHTVPITLGPDGPYIHAFQLNSNTFTIGGDAVGFQAVIRNPTDAIVEGVTIWGRIVQGTTNRVAGSEIVRGCEAGFNIGDLPPNGECTVNGGFVAQNASGGEGTLEPGGATLEVWIQTQHQVLHSFTRFVVLQ